MLLFFLQVSREGAQSIKNLEIWGQILSKGEEMMQSLPPRVLDRRLQEDWARAAKEDPRVFMNLRVGFWAQGPSLGPLFVNIRIDFSFFWALYLAILVV